MTRFLLGFFSFGWLRGLDFLPPLLLRLFLAPLLWVSGSNKLGLFSAADSDWLNPLTWVDMAYSDAHPELRKKSGGAPNWTRYRSRFITSKHINTGTAFWNKHRRTLERAANQYGVPEEYILGIMFCCGGLLIGLTGSHHRWRQ